MKREEILEVLNNIGTQESHDWVEDLDFVFWEENVKNKFKVIETDIDIDRHRWYALCDEIFEIQGYKFIVTKVCDVYSESMMIKDIYHKLVFSIAG